MMLCEAASHLEQWLCWISVFEDGDPVGMPVRLVIKFYLLVGQRDGGSPVFPLLH